MMKPIFLGFHASQLDSQLQLEMQQREQEEAADALGKVALCRRVLLQYHAIAHHLHAWRQQKAAAEQLGQKALLRWAFARFHSRVKYNVKVKQMALQRGQRVKRGVIQAWKQRVQRKGEAVYTREVAGQHWRRRLQRRVLAHWGYWQQQVQCLSPSALSSCSDGELAMAEQGERGAWQQRGWGSDGDEKGKGQDWSLTGRLRLGQQDALAGRAAADLGLEQQRRRGIGLVGVCWSADGELKSKSRWRGQISPLQGPSTKQGLVKGSPQKQVPRVRSSSGIKMQVLQQRQPQQEQLEQEEPGWGQRLPPAGRESTRMQSTLMQSGLGRASWGKGKSPSGARWQLEEASQRGSGRRSISPQNRISGKCSLSQAGVGGVWPSFSGCGDSRLSSYAGCDQLGSFEGSRWPSGAGGHSVPAAVQMEFHSLAVAKGFARSWLVQRAWMGWLVHMEVRLWDGGWGKALFDLQGYSLIGSCNEDSLVFDRKEPHPCGFSAFDCAFWHSATLNLQTAWLSPALLVVSVGVYCWLPLGSAH